MILFTYNDCVQDALVKGYDQNVDFYTLLLNSADVRDRIARVFMHEIYKLLKGEQPGEKAGHESAPYRMDRGGLMMVAESPAQYGSDSSGGEHQGSADDRK